MALLRYVSHPNVHIDPGVAVPRWRLSDRGRERAAALSRHPWWADVVRLVSSDETKARETAAIVAARFGLDVEVRPRTGEVDRSSTGYVPAERHDALSVALFARPEASADGWERAVDAQRRVHDALADLLVDGPGDVVVVGHGGVGTLLWCHLADLTIDTRHDQPGQGHHWAWDRTGARPVHAWLPIEDAGDASSPG